MTDQYFLENSIEQSFASPIDRYINYVTDVCEELSQQDFCLIKPEQASQLLSLKDKSEWTEFASSWNNLEMDHFMADGGGYRKRRHATLSALPSSCVWVIEPHQPHYQSLYYNELNGDMKRLYKPIEDDILNNRVFKSIINLCCEIFGRISPFHTWHIEVHQFRIIASEENPGSPTPEGIHRDGVNYVLMMLIDRENVTGGVLAFMTLSVKSSKNSRLYIPRRLR